MTVLPEAEKRSLVVDTLVDFNLFVLLLQSVRVMCAPCDTFLNLHFIF